MARAVNQSIAWIAALFLSLIVFGVGLAIVFSMKPTHRDDHDQHDSSADHETADDSGHHGAVDTEHPADHKTKDSHAKPKIEHEDSHAKDGGDEEKEITPASVKAQHGEHVPEAKPHH